MFVSGWYELKISDADREHVAQAIHLSQELSVLQQQMHRLRSHASGPQPAVKFVCSCACAHFAPPFRALMLDLIYFD